MTCDEARTLITIQAFGTLDPADLVALDAHTGDCQACAQAAAHSAAVRAAVDTPAHIPEPDWERSWDEIAARSLDRVQPLWRRPAFRGWAAAAAAVAVFAVGITVGRRLPPAREPGQVVENGEPEGAMTSLEASSPLREYSQRIERVLGSLDDQTASAGSAAPLDARRSLLRSMIEDTRALQSLAARAGDVELEAFLSEIEPLLVSLANLQPGDRGSAEWLNRVVRERGLRTRARELARPAVRS
jgi:anti-sigma factor ChrR (cupin superfamily)